MFGLNPVQIAKNELKKFDQYGKKGVPDVLEALDAAEAGLTSLAEFIEGFDREEIEAVLMLFNNCRKPTSKQTEDELATLAGNLQAVPIALRKAATALEDFEKELK